MSKEMKNYWLHRISHWSEVSSPLLEKGYLSIGFSAIASPEFLTKVKNDDVGEAWSYFAEEYEKVYGKNRTRMSLWRFVREFKVGDKILVPTPREFSVYEVTGDVMVSSQFKEEIVDEKRSIKAGDKGLQYNGEEVDLGFLMPVRHIEKNISRYNYADSALTSRMKIYQTNTNLNLLRESVDKAVKRAKEKRPLSLYGDVIDGMRKILLKEIKEQVDDNKFEDLVKWYFERIGASNVRRLAKYNPNIKKGSDADVEAEFDALGILVLVQAKRHKGKTNAEAVNQIREYIKEYKEDDRENYSSVISWVVSSAEGFTEDAISEAAEKNIRLISGDEFAEMLIKAGLSSLQDFDS